MTIMFRQLLAKLGYDNPLLVNIEPVVVGFRVFATHQLQLIRCIIERDKDFTGNLFGFFFIDDPKTAM